MDLRCHRLIKKDLKLLDKKCKHAKDLVSSQEPSTPEEDILSRPMLVSAYTFFCNIVNKGEMNDKCRKWNHQWYLDRGIEIWKLYWAIDTKGPKYGLRIMIAHIASSNMDVIIGIFRKHDVDDEQAFQNDIRNRMKEYFA